MAIDYARLDYERAAHHRRFVSYVEAHGLPCQDCGAMGSYIEVIDPWLGGPRYDCGWCEGTGRTTRYLRGLWLKWRREEKKSRRDRGEAA